MRVVVLGHTEGWLRGSWSELLNHPNTCIWNTKYPINNHKVLSFLARIHFSKKANSIIRLPFKNLWYKMFAENISVNTGEELLLIVYDNCRLGTNKEFLDYLRKRFKHIRMIYVMTNEVRFTYAFKNGFVDFLNDFYDQVYAFHKSDYEKYGFKVIPLIYSRYEIEHGEKKHCVFFAGGAKDRLEKLLEIHDHIRELGVDTDFYIIRSDTQVDRKGITWNRILSYEEVIRKTQECSVIIEVPQGILEAFTIKVCEAIFYDKLLITTNKMILEAPFYDDRWMLYIEKPEDITKEFLDRWKSVHYEKKARDYFSMNTFLRMACNDVGINPPEWIDD